MTRVPIHRRQILPSLFRGRAGLVLALAVAAGCGRKAPSDGEPKAVGSASVDAHSLAIATHGADAEQVPSAPAATTLYLAATSPEPLEVWALDDGTVLVGHHDLIAVSDALAGRSDAGTHGEAMRFGGRRPAHVRGLWPTDVRATDELLFAERASAIEVRSLQRGTWATLFTRASMRDTLRAADGTWWLLDGDPPRVHSVRAQKGSTQARRSTPGRPRSPSVPRPTVR